MMHKKSSKFTTIGPHSIVFKENRVHKFNIITVKTATAGLLFFLTRSTEKLSMSRVKLGSTNTKYSLWLGNTIYHFKYSSKYIQSFLCLEIWIGTIRQTT